MSSSNGKNSSGPSIPSGLPSEAFRTAVIDTNPWRSKAPTHLKTRGRPGTAGKPQQIDVNSHVVTQFPTRDIFQYDVGFPLETMFHPQAKTRTGLHWLWYREAWIDQSCR